MKVWFFLGWSMIWSICAVLYQQINNIDMKVGTAALLILSGTAFLFSLQNCKGK